MENNCTEIWAAALKARHEAYVAARQDFDEANIPALKTLNDAIDIARQIYQDTMASAQQDYLKANNILERNLEEVRATLNSMS